MGSVVVYQELDGDLKRGVKQTKKGRRGKAHFQARRPLIAAGLLKLRLVEWESGARHFHNSAGFATFGRCETGVTFLNTRRSVKKRTFYQYVRWKYSVGERRDTTDKLRWQKFFTVFSMFPLPGKVFGLSFGFTYYRESFFL